MNIVVKVIPRAKQESIIQTSEGIYTARVTATPEKGKANDRVRTLLADYFQIGRNAVTIQRGHRGRTKYIVVDI